MNILSLFDGISCGRVALERANIKVDKYYASEIDKYAIQISNKNFPDIIQLGDINNWKSWNLSNIDLLIGGSPCFVKDTLILTKLGYKKIQDILIGDEVLSHSGRWKRVLNVGYRDNVSTRIICGFGNNGIETTNEHPFYIREMTKTWNNLKRCNQRNFNNPIWKSAIELNRNDYCSSVVLPNNQKKEIDKIFWYMIGRYTGDGWFRKSKRKQRKNSYVYQFIICCGENEFEELKEKFDNFGYKYNFSKERTVYKFRICNMKLVSFVEKIGVGASNKIVHPDLFDNNNENRKSYLEGIWDSDGWHKEKDDVYKLTTTSNLLAVGLQELIYTVYKTPVRFSYIKRPKTCIIEKRIVNQKDTYEISYKLDKRKQDKAFYENNYIWMPIKQNYITNENKIVYNLEVEEDNSYLVNNIIVHNCQGFSNAGKGLNFEDSRSKLFFTFIDILKYYKPKYFLLENVKMKKEWQKIISELVEVEPIEINSALVSAQSRKRLYWTNIQNIMQPKDMDILLKDIIESGTVDRDKSYCIDANYYKGGSLKNYLEKSRRQIVNLSPKNLYQSEKCLMVKDCVQIGEADINGFDIIKRVYSIKGKSPSLTTMQGGYREPKISEDNITWRKLTPIECERLQTLPDNYTAGISNTQRYKCLGNGWTVDVIAHIFSFLPNEWKSI